jgi:hypothetical protein
MMEGADDGLPSTSREHVAAVEATLEAMGIEFLNGDAPACGCIRNADAENDHNKRKTPPAFIIGRTGSLTKQHADHDH